MAPRRDRLRPFLSELASATWGVPPHVASRRGVPSRFDSGHAKCTSVLLFKKNGKYISPTFESLTLTSIYLQFRTDSSSINSNFEPIQVEGGEFWSSSLSVSSVCFVCVFRLFLSLCVSSLFVFVCFDFVSVCLCVFRLSLSLCVLIRLSLSLCVSSLSVSVCFVCVFCLSVSVCFVSPYLCVFRLSLFMWVIICELLIVIICEL